MYEYWVVAEINTGKIICHCGELNDAIMMVSFDPTNRTYNRNRFIMDQIIDVNATTDKQLSGQIGLPSGKNEQLTHYTQKLPQAEGEPIIIN